MLTACDEGDPSATESTRRKAFNLDELPETKMADACYRIYFIIHLAQEQIRETLTASCYTFFFRSCMQNDVKFIQIRKVNEEG